MDTPAGQKAQQEMTVTQETVNAYAAITSGYNPLHFNIEFTGKTCFEPLIAQGGVNTVLLHALVAMDMPGPLTVFTNQSWAFPNPVYISNTLHAQTTVLSVHRRLPMAYFAFRVVNQHREEVLTCEATVYQATPTS